MADDQDQVSSVRPPRLRRRTIAFALLLLGFGVAMLVCGLEVGMTTAGLPPEHHPSLLLCKDDAKLIQERLAREPYRSWLERLEDSVAQSDPFAVTSHTERARQAKALAFLYVATRDRTHADRAAALLDAERPPSRGGIWKGLDEMVQAAGAYAIAYDLLAGYLRSEPVLEARVRLLVYQLGEELYRSRYTWPSPGGDTRTIRQFSALGLCALAIRGFTPPAEHSAPSQWYRRARREIAEAFARQVCADGAYAEGPGRHFEAAVLYVPFSVACQKTVGEGFLADAPMNACEWSVRIRMPNGLRPSIDGACLTPSCGFLLANSTTPRGGLFRWDAQAPSFADAVPFDQLPEALTLFDDKLKPQAPPWSGSGALEDSGDVVFRSGWRTDDTYLLLRGEKHRARNAGGVFEQADSTSFVLCRGHETLVLDTGWGGWGKRRETSGGAAHNMLLVDGAGPPVQTALGAVMSVDVDVTVSDVVIDRQVQTARLHLERNGATIERTAVFLGEDVILFDNAAAKQGKHDYTWVLHPNAGGDTGGSLSLRRNEAVVRRPDAALLVAVEGFAPEGAHLEREQGTHYLQMDQPRHHTALRATVHDQLNAQFLSVLSTRDRVSELPRVAVSRSTKTLSAVIGQDVRCCFRAIGQDVVGTAHVMTDGYGLVWRGPNSDVPDYVLALGATWLRIDGRLVWKSRGSETVVWRLKQELPPRLSKLR